MDDQTALIRLQKKCGGDESSLFAHLSELVLETTELERADVDMTQMSELIKKKALRTSPRDGLVPNHPPADAKAATSALQMYGDPQPPIDQETGMPIKVVEPNTYECEDMVKSARMFQAIGCGLGASELYEAMLHLKHLGEDPSAKLKRVRFFGKFFGLFADYYVFEAAPKEAAPVTSETEEEKAKREAERRFPAEQASGANASVYYVCNTLGKAHVERLPDVRPEHIASARSLKRCLTGRLSSKVSKHPPFPWNESVFLRAQIARISAATTLVPAGWLTQEDNEDGTVTLAPAEDAGSLAMPDAEPEEWLSSWVHRWGHVTQAHMTCRPQALHAASGAVCMQRTSITCLHNDASTCAPRLTVRAGLSPADLVYMWWCRHAHLKRQGRCDTKPIREPLEDAEEEVELDADEQEEAPEAGQYLAPISEDANVYGRTPWVPVFSSASKLVKGQVMGVRSVTWPGAAAVTYGQIAANLYVGWGIKNAAYVPLPPPPIAQEFDQSQLISIDMPAKEDPDAEAPPEGAGEEE